MTPRRGAAGWPALALASLLAVTAVTAPATAAPATRHAAPVRRAAARAQAPAAVPVAGLAHEIREIEEVGGWARAAEMMRSLRGRVAPDADLELMLAWNEARSGQLDSAWARISGPMFRAAGDDSVPAFRRIVYPWEHEALWLDGRFDGWYWYVWRTRAELAAALGRWDDALGSARRAVAARPLSGIEWYIRGLCAAHAGAMDEARACADTALVLDPSLAEAHYLSGLIAWRAGRRSEAQSRFLAAIALDSTWTAPALAQLRSRLPASVPDTLPVELLQDERRAGLLTAPERPKREVFVQDSAPAGVVRRVLTPDVDTTGITPRDQRRATLSLTVLIGSDGRVAMVDPPPELPGGVSLAQFTRLVATLPEWRFAPATRLGRAVPSWAALEFSIIP